MPARMQEHAKYTRSQFFFWENERYVIARDRRAERIPAGYLIFYEQI